MPINIMATGINYFQAVPGYFHHFEEPTGPGFRAETQENMGLIHRAYYTDAAFDPEGRKSQWQRFIHHLEQLNKYEAGRTQYKLIFLIRHGQGHHNIKEAEVGRQVWDSYWSHLDGDSKSVWADSELSVKGVQQARYLNTFWGNAIANGMPAPQRYYTSPLTRCLQTTLNAYSGLNVPADRPFKPIVKENIREQFGVHTSDRRGTRSHIASNFPQFQIEPSLTEDDQLWLPHHRETNAEIDDRVSKLLQDIFDNDVKSILSFTAHSGFLRSLYRVTHHPEVWVSAGAMVPVLIRGYQIPT
ncbi:phosphoglycerate mutase-like protein [Daldinia sp. FL1419]|nr:phosphoglycerate mutase-like protein [Daldinia sp. FL1419]